MRTTVFLLVLIVLAANAFAVDYDTTKVYIYSVNVQQQGVLRHYATVAGDYQTAEKQLSLVFTSAKSEAISGDSIRVWFNVLEFILEDGSIDTSYAILQDIQNMNPVADTLAQSWFDKDFWKAVYDATTPYYVPIE